MLRLPSGCSWKTALSRAASPKSSPKLMTPNNPGDHHWRSLCLRTPLFKIRALAAQNLSNLRIGKHFHQSAFYRAPSPKALAPISLTTSAPESLCRGRLRRQLEYFPNLLHPLERLRIVAQAQTHHTVIPVHSPGYMNEQQPKALQARGSFLLIQAQPFNGTDYIIGQERYLEPRRVDSKTLTGDMSAAQLILHFIVRI